MDVTEWVFLRSFIVAIIGRGGQFAVDLWRVLDEIFWLAPQNPGIKHLIRDALEEPDTYENRLATRCDKTAARYLDFIGTAAVHPWARRLSTDFTAILYQIE